MTRQPEIRGPMAAIAIAIIVVAVVGAMASAQRRPDSRARISPADEQRLRDAMAAYAGGDDRAPAQWASATRAPVFLAYLDLIVRRESTTWDRATPAFVLEVAASIQDSRMFRVPSLLTLGQSLVVGRPTPLGANPDEDRFELLWHQAALGIAQGLEQYWLQQDLLTVIRARYAAAGESILQSSRVPLAQGIAAAGLCCWERAPGEVIQMVPPSGRRRVDADEALRLLESAAALPPLHAEALIRGGVLLARLGKPAEALEWLDRVPPHDDAMLNYVQHLTRGRLFDGADRAADAVAAYRRAFEAEPRSQVAAIGLAAALLRSGRAPEAADVAARARTLGSEITRHDQAFRQADLRFVPEWLREIRRLRR